MLIFDESHPPSPPPSIVHGLPWLAPDLRHKVSPACRRLQAAAHLNRRADVAVSIYGEALRGPRPLIVSVVHIERKHVRAAATGNSHVVVGNSGTGAMAPEFLNGPKMGFCLCHLDSGIWGLTRRGRLRPARCKVPGQAAGWAHELAIFGRDEASRGTWAGPVISCIFEPRVHICSVP